MEIVKLLDQLKEELERPRQFLGLTFGMNRDECAVLLRRIHNALPDEVKEAQKITRDAERLTSAASENARTVLERAKAEGVKLMDAARKEAERTLEQARIERERLTNEHEVLKAAKSEAERTRGEAEQEAVRLRRSADDYALDVLTRLESNLAKALSAVERGKSDLQRPTKSLGQPVAK